MGIMFDFQQKSHQVSEIDDKPAQHKGVPVVAADDHNASENKPLQYVYLNVNRHTWDKANKIGADEVSDDISTSVSSASISFSVDGGSWEAYIYCTLLHA